ncbi:MAG: 3-deoxy-7-phosphoheptulonate synthase, partial [Candidatus Vogelbacteria bacterium]|nr:3-deoxy-7-phosphoheptulonate synthase [Candidatus Vogelbacteria bacterium]
MNTQLSYKNIVSDDPVPTPMELKAEFPATPVAEATVLRSRDTIERILEGADPRKILVVG